MHPITIRSWYYQQFDMDVSREVPAEGSGGWKQAELAFDRDRMALVIMHALDCGGPDDRPWLYSSTEYLVRADAIAREVFPSLIGSVRAAGMRLYHVIPSGMNCHSLPGYQRALKLGGPKPRRARIEIDDPLMKAVEQFRMDHVMPGAHNDLPAHRQGELLSFYAHATPEGEEGVVETSEQLLALCQADGINHLVYCGFTINECIAFARGGMMDMCRRGLMCSTIRQAVTAIENRESARTESHKEQALWRVAYACGFVFNVDDLVEAVAGVQECRRDMHHVLAHRA